MDGSPGTPQLLTNIQFAEAKKGYDRDQVDNFLRELSTKIGELQDMLRQATARAEAAEARAAEATKAKVLADTMADKAKADAAKALEQGPREPANEVEAAAGMLALAQQTAEAAIAAAESRAKDVVAEARTKAAMIVVEVEQEVERIKAAATAEAEAIVTDRATDIEEEVRRLESLRDGLQGDVDLLQGHLDAHRQRLRDGVDALAKLLDDGGFDPIDGGDGGPGSKATKSIFDPSTPAATDAADVDVAEPTPVTAEADASADTTARSDEALPVFEFVPEPEPTSIPALNLVAPLGSHTDSSTDGESDEATESGESGDLDRVDTTDGDDQDDRKPTAELTIVTLEDLSSSAADDASAFAPSKRVDPESERRAAQIPSLLEAPATLAEPEPAPSPAEPQQAREPEIVLDAPIFRDDPKPAAATDAPAPASIDDDREPEPVEAAQPVAQPAADAAPMVIAATGTDGGPSTNSSVINLTAARLFGEPVVEGEQTQAFDVLADDAAPRLTLQRTTPAPPGEQSPLGEPDADADAAMRAFFEQDLAKLERDQPKGGRFLRRK